MRATITWGIRALPLALLAACVGSSGVTISPAPTAGPLADVPRNRTLTLAVLLRAPIGVTNPWSSLGYTHAEGNSLLWEGLAYYAIYADREIPWLAAGMEYTQPDFRELTITLNPLARWSDG